MLETFINGTLSTSTVDKENLALALRLATAPLLPSRVAFWAALTNSFFEEVEPRRPLYYS